MHEQIIYEVTRSQEQLLKIMKYRVYHSEIYFPNINREILSFATLHTILLAMIKRESVSSLPVQHNNIIFISILLYTK